MVNTMCTIDYDNII